MHVARDANVYADIRTCLCIRMWMFQTFVQLLSHHYSLPLDVEIRSHSATAQQIVAQHHHLLAANG